MVGDGAGGCGCTLIDAHEGQETLWTGWGGAKSWALAGNWQVRQARDFYHGSLIEARWRVAVSDAVFAGSLLSLFVLLLWLRPVLDTLSARMWELDAQAAMLRANCLAAPTLRELLLLLHIDLSCKENRTYSISFPSLISRQSRWSSVLVLLLHCSAVCTKLMCR